MALLLILWILCALGAWAVATSRGASAAVGLALGFFLGPLGLAFAFALDGHRCPHCRSGIAEGATRCPHCQAELTPPEIVWIHGQGVPVTRAKGPITAPPTKKCPDCAEDVRVEARKCRFCGCIFN